MGAIDDLVSNLKNAVSNISHLNSSLQSTLTTLIAVSTSLASGTLDLVAINTSLIAINTAILTSFPRISGTFTLANATLSPVTNNQVRASFVVAWSPTNATAALTERTNGLFLQAVTAGSGFVVSTQSGSAIGTETFQYIGFNPS
jgi:hypothetical protein